MPDLILEVPSSLSFKKKENRQRFIRHVAALLGAGADRPFEPYQLNPQSGDLEWVVDAGNDWMVFFDRDNPLRVRLKQRYDVMEALLPLGQFVAYRWRAKVVAPQVAQA